MTTENQAKPAVFHEGEIAIQERLGVAQRMDKFARMVVRDYMPDQHQDFYQSLPMLFAGYMDDENNVWASVIAQPNGLVSINNDKSLSINSKPFSGDPLNDVLRAQTLNASTPARIGLLGIQPETRRRNRMSAQFNALHDKGFNLDVVQAFGNCPQYIQQGQITPIHREKSEQSQLLVDEFDDALSAIINKADTFYVASSTKAEYNNASKGADVSHRGGRPGFIRIDDNKTLTIPDFIGNNHFNTLGNFLVNDSAGLLFIDFDTGDVVMLTGKATILWDHDAQKHFKGAERMWQFSLSKGYVLKAAMPFRFDFQQWSPNSLMTGTWEEANTLTKQDAKKNQWLQWHIDKIVDESASVRSFYFATDSNTTPDFQAGQFISVKVNIEGKSHIRTYSVSSSPLDNFIRISVKRDGLVSGFLHDNVKQGHGIDVKLPQGNFTLSDNQLKPAVLLAAGVGITPMVSMFRQIVKEGIRTRSGRNVVMINTFKDRSDQAFFDEINQLSSDAKGHAKAFWLLTRPSEHAELGVHYSSRGRLSPEKLQALLPIGRYDFYLCGPVEFMQQTYDLLIELGVPDCDIYAEAFGPASLNRLNPEPQPTDVAKSAVITFSESNVEQAWLEEDGNILDFAESHGLTPDFGCRGGSCGSCKVKIKQGQVVHSQQATFPVQKDEALLCCSMPRKTQSDQPVKLVLDL